MLSPFRAIIKSAAVNILVHDFWWAYLFLMGIYPGVDLQSCRIYIVSVGTAKH